MKNKFLTFLLFFAATFCSVSCVSQGTTYSSSETNTSSGNGSYKSRDLILNGETYFKEFLDTYEVTSWYCTDYFGKSSKVLVEVGYIDFVNSSTGEKMQQGFILYDGTAKPRELYKAYKR